MSLEELMAIMNGQLKSSEKAKPTVSKKTKNKPKRKNSKRDKILSQELAIMNKRARNKNGKMRKGWSQSKIMSMAHKATRKRMKK